MGSHFFLWGTLGLGLGAVTIESNGGFKGTRPL
jgi:hypothetical protein